MTQKLKISIVETVEKEKEITAEEAAGILFEEYVGGYLEEWYEWYVPKSMKLFKGIWSCKSKIASDPRPATDAEIKAWHRLEIGKYCQYRCDADTLKDKEVILEVVDE